MATTAKKKPLSKKTTLFDENEGPGLVDPKLLRHLRDHFGFDGFKQNQGAIIKSVLSGKDTFVIMPTGGGKSLCYQLPAMMSEGVAIIVSPLIALMKNQVDLVRSYSSKDSVAHCVRCRARGSSNWRSNTSNGSASAHLDPSSRSSI